MNPDAILRTLWLAASLPLAASSIWAQDPAKISEKQLHFWLDETGKVMVKVDPSIYKCTLDNERVRVCEITFKPGAKIGLHWHPDRVVYSVAGGTLTVIDKDGRAKDIEYSPGQVFWFTASSHSAVNNGTVEVKLVMVELKQSSNE